MSAYTAEQTAQIDWPRRWKAYGIPSRFWNFGLGDMVPAEPQGYAWRGANGMVETWPERRTPPVDTSPAHTLLGVGQIYIGAYATGKTRLACATATDIARRYNTSVLYMPVTEFFALGRKLRDATDAAVKLRDPGAAEEAVRIRRLLKLVETTPLLVWDDMGKEYGTASGYNGSEVYRILRTRFDRNRPSILTTNIPLPEWSERYEGSMFSFLHEAFDAFTLKGADRRRAKR